MKAIFVAILLAVSVVTTFGLTYTGTQVLGQAPTALAPSTDTGAYWNRFPVNELPISTPPPVVNLDHPEGKNIALIMPSDCMAKDIIGVSNGRMGLILTYRTEKGMVKAAQYQNPQAGTGPDYIYIFIRPLKD